MQSTSTSTITSRSLHLQHTRTRPILPILASTQLFPSSSQRRSVHIIPQLPNQDEYIQSGLQPLFSGPGFDMVWRQYQSYLIDNLNRLVAGTEYEDKTPREIAVMTSKNSDQAAIFNYASTAHNNHFFFESITGAIPPPAPQNLEDMIRANFYDMASFKATLLTTAEAVFSNAFVWVVLDTKRDLRILVTYNSGTPYAGIYRRQSVDTNTMTPDGRNDSAPFSGTISEVHLGHGRQDDREGLVPLLCVNVWIHTYIRDHGIRGKREYLEKWFDRINWSVVADRLPGKSSATTFRM